MIACFAARPWMFGPRLGHIRVRNDEIRCELVRYVLSDEHLRTQCQQGFSPEWLHLWAAAETSEPSSQGGSMGSNPIGATNRGTLALAGIFAFRGRRAARDSVRFGPRIRRSQIGLGARLGTSGLASADSWAVRVLGVVWSHPHSIPYGAGSAMITLGRVTQQADADGDE